MANSPKWFSIFAFAALLLAGACNKDDGGGSGGFNLGLVKGKFLYIAGNDLFLGTPGDTARVRLTNADPDGVNNARLSPDATQILYQNTAGGVNYVKVMTISGANIRTVAQGGVPRMINWVPGAANTVSYLDGLNLVRTTLDGSTTSTVTLSSQIATVADYAWSPDGQKVAIADRMTGGDEHIWVMDADGSNLKAVYTKPLPSPYYININDLDWSGDGAYWAFDSFSGNLEILRTTDGSSVKVIGLGFTPRFSRDGRLLMFTSTTYAAVAAVDWVGETGAALAAGSLVDWRD